MLLYVSSFLLPSFPELWADDFVPPHVCSLSFGLVFWFFFECPFLLMKNVSCVEFSCRKNPKATPTDYLMCFYLRDIRRV